MQEMCIQAACESKSLHNVKAAEVNAKLDALISADVLAATQPPASFPVPQCHQKPAKAGQLLSELEEHRRKITALQQERDDALRQRDDVQQKLDRSMVCSSVQFCTCVDPDLQPSASSVAVDAACCPRLFLCLQG